MTTPLVSTRLHPRVAIVICSSSGLIRVTILAFAAKGAFPMTSSGNCPSPRGLRASVNSILAHELIWKRCGERKAIYVQTDDTVVGDMELLTSRAVHVGGHLDM